MTVPLSVGEVRKSLYHAAGLLSGGGKPSTALLGKIFHETFAILVGPDPSSNFHAALDEIDPLIECWRSALLDHAYGRNVGARLRENQAFLSDSTAELLTFWHSMRSMCDWLSSLLWTAREAGLWDDLTTRLISVEEQLVWELREPGWTDTVRLTGIADSIWRIPGKEIWCLVEMKTGRASPEADLAQACLYHQMLSSQSINLTGDLALINFEPEPRERMITGPELREAQDRLINLIGRLAGVAEGKSKMAPRGRQKESQNKTSKPFRKGASKKQARKPSPATDPIEFEEQARNIEKIFKEYGIEVNSADHPVKGPAYIRFYFSLGRGVRITALSALTRELQIKLGLDSPPLVRIVDGRVAIDTQRRNPEVVLFEDIQEQLAPIDTLFGNACVPVGVDIEGKLRSADFSQPENAHMLIAGCPGSGKSEFLRSIVAGLILTNTTETLKLLLIDPKRNAFHEMAGAPYLFKPIVYPDENDVTGALESMVELMERRYLQFGQTGANCLADYVKRTNIAMPRIFCICDEYADLLLGSRNMRAEIELLITRLGQKARASGIHLILATQRASRETVKGVIDSNIPARVAMKMARAIESRMLLDQPGAENLLGRGDLLFKCIGDPIRLQAAYIPADKFQKLLNI